MKDINKYKSGRNLLYIIEETMLNTTAAQISLGRSSFSTAQLAKDLLSHRLQGELQFARHEKSLYQLEFLDSWLQ